MRRERQPKRGFTLLEILVATALFAVGMVTVFTLFPIGIFAVRETVNGTRGAAIARSARAEMTAMRADMKIMDSFSRTWSLSWGSAGPWESPSYVDVFTESVCEYLDVGVPPTLHRRILFDDRTMVPITLQGTVDAATDTISVVASSVTRAADRLHYYYDTGAGDFGAWEFNLRVGGIEYPVTGAAYNVADVRDLQSLTVFDPAGTLVTGANPVTVDVLFPAAWREPPVEVPQVWGGGYLDMTASPYVLDGTLENRNLAQYLCGNGPDNEGWISIGGDWVQVTSVTVDADGMPTDVTLAAPPVLTGWQPFEMLLPVVRFNLANEDAGPDAVFPSDDDFLILPVISQGARTGGGGQHLSMLESGAEIEILLDGFTADFDPNNAFGRQTVIGDNTTINATTSGFIAAGNYIRIDGRDYEIASALYDADADASFDDFDLVGTVPDFGPARYFNIALGYIPGAAQLPKVARFPVSTVTRAGNSERIISFNVARDANGNLPTDHGLGAAAFENPVHVLPENFSQFAYQVVFNQKALAGDFSVATTVAPPSVAADTPASFAFAGSDYPLDGNWVAYNGVNSIYTLFALNRLLPAGFYQNSGLAGMTVATPPAIQLPGAMAGASEVRPFHLIDRNDFIQENSADDMSIGQGAYSIAPDTVALTVATLTDNASFLAVGLRVSLQDTAGPNSATGTILTYNEAAAPPTITLALDAVPPSTLVGGETVTVTILETNVPVANNNYARGRGLFATGSDTIQAVAAVQALHPATKGFPYNITGQRRFHLGIGDYILAPDGEYYAVKAIRTDAANGDAVILDRVYLGSGAAAGDHYFQYYTMTPEVYNAQVTVFRRFATTSLIDNAVALTRSTSAAFGYDGAGARFDDKVHLAVALPPNVKPGDYIRAEGDADHAVALTANTDVGLGDAIDGDWRWYMIDSISDDRLEITLASPYRGYMRGAADPETWQPASISTTVIRTFDTTMGAF